MVIIRKDLETNCKLLWCKLTADWSSEFLFGVFYRPPNTKADYMELLAESISQINNLNMDKVFLTLTGLTSYTC